MNGRVRAAKMPNPSIATAVESYAGIMNIRDTFALSVTRLSRLLFQNSGDTAPKDV
jgi:hypothetical protein